MIDTNDSEFLSRIEDKDLLAKVCDAKTAAGMIQPGDILGISGFTPCGYPKITMHELAERMKETPFQVDIWTGASTGSQIDTELVAVNGIRDRMPYQTNSNLRKAINAGTINYFDLHLSHVAQQIRAGFFTNVHGERVTGPDFAVVEVCKIVNDNGKVGLVPTTAIGNSPVFVDTAKKVIVEVNTTQPKALDGMADIYMRKNPPFCEPIPIKKTGDRIGTTYIPVDPEKIVAIVPCDLPDVTRPLAPLDDDAIRMGNNLVDFLKNEVKQGRLPENLLPLQSGVGNVANAVINGLVNSDFKNLTVYTEVIQDGMFDLIDKDKIDMISGTSLSPSPDGLKRFYANIEKYSKKIILRPQEISNNGEVARRIGVIAMNTALEMDVYGHVNSTHVSGTKLMNGIGGSGDFARNGFLSCFFCHSVAKGGKISAVVPMCSHVDHTEHDTHVFISEQGVADVRGLSPKERAKLIINNVAHPDYRAQLMDYFERACAANGNSQTPHLLAEAFDFHKSLAENGTMLFKK